MKKYNLVFTLANGQKHEVPFSVPRGNDGRDGRDGVDGHTPVKDEDYFDGKDGHTPVKGVDYFTEEDRTVLVNELEEKAIGNIESALDEIIAMQNELIGGDAS